MSGDTLAPAWAHEPRNEKTLTLALCPLLRRSTSGGPFALRKAFKYFDRDGSGDIDPDEFFAAMDWFGLQFTEDGVLGLFGLYDDDRGGSLGYYEFVENLIDGFAKASPGKEVKNQLAEALLETAHAELDVIKSPSAVTIDQCRRAFDYCDYNGSGRIELSELGGVLKALGLNADSDTVNHAMLVLDKDCSGDVSFEEFWEWWQYSNSIKGSPSSTRRGRPRGGNMDSGKQSRTGSSLSGATLDMTNRNGNRSPEFGRRAPKSPMMGAHFANSVRGSSPSMMGSTSRFGSTQGDNMGPPSTGIPKWSPPKPGAYIRQP